MFKKQRIIMSNPLIKDLLYNECTARIIAHLELWFYPGSSHCNDPSRNPGYNQHDPTFVNSHVTYFKSLGITDLMFNTYGESSPENISLLLYLAACESQGMGIIINIDKGVYTSAPNPQQAILDYLSYIRKTSFGLSMYQKFDGKFIVTYFTAPSDNPSIFREVEAVNPDVLFVYNDPTKGPTTNGNNMAWIQSDLTLNLDWWIKTYGLLPGLQIPCLYVGFNDTNSLTKQSCWGGPARVWPSTGPNISVFQDCCKVIAKYYSSTNQPHYIQIVTANDWQEGSAVEQKLFGNAGYFSPIPPPVVNHGEIWIDGNKLSDLTLGAHELTLVDVYSDNSVIKIVSTIKV
jgi:hypothetical protein